MEGYLDVVQKAKYVFATASKLGRAEQPTIGNCRRVWLTSDCLLLIGSLVTLSTELDALDLNRGGEVCVYILSPFSRGSKVFRKGSVIHRRAVIARSFPGKRKTHAS